MMSARRARSCVRQRIIYCVCECADMCERETEYCHTRTHVVDRVVETKKKKEKKKRMNAFPKLTPHPIREEQSFYLLFMSKKKMLFSLHMRIHTHPSIHDTLTLLALIVHTMRHSLSRRLSIACPLSPGASREGRGRKKEWRQESDETISSKWHLGE